MKTKFTINKEIFWEHTLLKDAYKEYEEDYREHGWILNKGDEEVYMIFDKEINLNEGDRVNMQDGFYRTVKWKCLHVLIDVVEYELIIE